MFYSLNIHQLSLHKTKLLALFFSSINLRKGNHEELVCLLLPLPLDKETSKVFHTDEAIFTP